MPKFMNIGQFVFFVFWLGVAVGAVRRNLAGPANGLVLLSDQCFQTVSLTTTLTPMSSTASASASQKPSVNTTVPPTLALSLAPAPTKQINLKYSEYLDSIKPDDKPAAGTPQYSYRELVYTKNIKKINDHNGNGKNSYLQDLNKFTDLDQAEFLAIYAKLILPNSGGQKGKKNVTDPVVSIPEKPVNQLRSAAGNLTQTTVNATTTPILGKNLLNITGNSSNANGAVSPDAYTVPPRISIDWSCKASAVINQGICGSCYIIAPLQTVLITMKIYDKPITPLSIQEVLSCNSPAPGQLNGCAGGFFDTSYQYLQNNGTGRALLYPYDPRAANQGFLAPCNNTVIQGTSYKGYKVKINSYVSVTSGDCGAVVDALKLRALAVAISASGFQFYRNGTFNSNSGVPNHGVTLVGYHPSMGYKIKNSWGISWGTNGFAYVSESTGVCDYAMYPVTGFENDPMGGCCV